MKMRKAVKPLCKYVGVVAVIIGVFMFVAPYLLDEVSAAVGQSVGAVAYFWGGMMWAAVGLLVAGLVLVGVSFALKDS